MLTLLAGALLTLSPATPVSAVDPPLGTHGEPKVARVIREWLRQYRKGKWAISSQIRVRPGGGTSPDDITKKSLLAKHKLVPASHSGPITYKVEIVILCRTAAQVGGPEAARAVLEVAAVGLDRSVKYSPRMAPGTVRRLGEDALHKMESKAVAEFLVAAAGGSESASKFGDAMQCAALRALGRRRDPAHRDIIAAQLSASESTVRAAAAHALGRLGEPFSIKQLAEHLAEESDGFAITEILAAIGMIREGDSGGGTKIEWMQMALIEAANALARSESWRTDLAIVDFLERFRSKSSISKLIWILERYENEPEKVRSGRLSGRLRVRTHEALTALTGTSIPMDKPARWREFWTKNEKDFRLAKVAPEKTDSATTAGGFFDIPVQGKRVVFVLDVSGSMNFPMRTTQSGPTVAGGARGGSSLKIDVAKRELWGAIQGLPADTKFNVIFYNQEFDRWSRKLVTAEEQNKKRFKRWLDGKKAQGATNIFDAMEDALKIKSLVYGDHYDSSVDEVFLLSDGMPNYGQVTSPNEILKIITETNRFSKVRINTVYLEGMPGRGPGMAPPGRSGADLMRRLAEQNAGRFVQP